MDSIRYIYTRATNEIEGVIEEKKVMFEELLYFIFSFSMKFSDSSKLLELLFSIYTYYIAIIGEINREHDIYLETKRYFQDLSDIEILIISENEDLLNEFIRMFDSLEDITERRILKHSKIYGFYNDLLDEPSLRNSYYKIIKHNDELTEEKKNSYLSLIPRR